MKISAVKRNTESKRFYIEFSGGYELDVADIWVDGDAPENPTVQDVVDVIEESWSEGRFIDDWNLIPTIEVRPIEK